jgi:bacillopeptidase F (M6 metalloprotease family)
VRLFYDDMELGSSLWSVDTAIGQARWALSDRLIHGGQYAWHVAADDRVTDARLATRTGVEVSENSTLSFWQWYDLEAAGDTAHDGGVLEAYVGGKWQDLGPHVLSGVYTHTIAQGVGNPLAGRLAWSGQSGDWQQVEVDLGPYAGSVLRIRFRWAGSDDNAQDYRGWYVDDVQITSVQPPSTHRYYMAPLFR